MRVREIAGMFTAGDYEILQKMKNNYLMNPDKLDQRGLDPTIIEYMSKSGPQL